MALFWDKNNERMTILCRRSNEAEVTAICSLGMLLVNCVWGEVLSKMTRKTKWMWSVVFGFVGKLKKKFLWEQGHKPDYS